MRKGDEIVPDVFHIGYHRTGSTFLQQLVLPQLSDVVYCVSSRFEMLCAAPDPEHVFNPYADISADEVAGRLVVDTQEDFSGHVLGDDLLIPRKIKNINPNAKIIVCIRSQYTILPSLYSLYIKRGGRLSYPRYCDQAIAGKTCDYNALIGAYTDVFSTQNVLVCLYEDLVSDPRDYVARIVDFLGLDDSFPNLDVSQVMNRRSKDLRISVMRFVNRFVRTREIESKVAGQRLRIPRGERQRRRRRIRRLLCNVLVQAATLFGLSGYRLNHDSQTELIRRTYAEGNRALFDRLGRDITALDYPGSRPGDFPHEQGVGQDSPRPAPDHTHTQ